MTETLMKDEYAIQLGRNIAKWRGFNRFKQPELASMVGVSKTTISNWENASFDITARNLHKLSVALKIEVKDLLPDANLLD